MSKTFNPLAAVQDLRNAGIDPKHADAYVDVLMTFHASRHHDKHATKMDGSLHELRRDLRGDMYWALGVHAAVVSVMLSVAFSLWG